MNLKKVIKKYNISFENIYNINESKFNIKEIEILKYIINRNIQQKFQKIKFEYQE